ncbi:MAG: hypothetical protein FWG49_07355, partial [Leptospirales bacterium]|nr:hypothetical protein [Leptospirales bacterium]
TDFEASSGRSDFDNIYIYFIGKAAGTTYDGTNASVGLRITGQNSDNVFYLIDPSITITKYSGYIEGSYEGEYPSSSGNIVKGSFVVKNFGDDKWPIPW